MLTGSYFSENRNPYLHKRKKNRFYYHNFYVFSAYQCSFIGFALHFVQFWLKFWENPEIQDGGYKMVTILQTCPNYHDRLRNHFEPQRRHLLTYYLSSKSHCYSFYTFHFLTSYGGGGGGGQCPPPRPQKTEKKPGLDSVKV